MLNWEYIVTLTSDFLNADFTSKSSYDNEVALKCHLLFFYIIVPRKHKGL